MADPTDRKAMLREQWDAQQGEEEEEVPAAEAAEEESEAAAEEPEPATEAEAAPEGETAEEKTARERDDQGRFRAAPKETPEKPIKPARVAPAAPAKPAAAVQVPAAPVVAAPAVKPPQSWSAAEREAWAKTPPEAQRAILRREQETARVLQESAQIRRQHGEVSQRWNAVNESLRRFDGIFAAEGTDALNGALGVVQTYAQLHYGNQQQKDAILAGLIGRFGSIDGLNAHLEGKAPTPQQAQPQPRPQPQADPRAIFREELQAMQERATSQRAERDFETFQATSPEFLHDVWEDMQTILDAASARGRNLTYQQAYDHALKMDDGIQSILKQRAEVAAVAAPSASAPTARARTAAATVRSRPAGVAGAAADPADRRAMLQQARDRLHQ